MPPSAVQLAVPASNDGLASRFSGVAVVPNCQLIALSSARPVTLRAPVPTSARYSWPGASGAAGRKVMVRSRHENEPAAGAPVPAPAGTSAKAASAVAGSIAASNVTDTAAPTGTPAAPPVGVTAVTAGAAAGTSKSAAAARRFGSGPMCPDVSSAWGEPVATSRLRTSCGLGALPRVAW